MLRNNGRRVVYSAGYQAAMMLARADLHALAGTFQREMTELYREVEELRREVAQLRQLAGVPALGQRLQ